MYLEPLVSQAPNHIFNDLRKTCNGFINFHDCFCTTSVKMHFAKILPLPHHSSIAQINNKFLFAHESDDLIKKRNSGY